MLIIIIGAINYQRIAEDMINMQKQKIDTLMEIVLISNLSNSSNSKIKSLCVFGNQKKAKCYELKEI